MFESKLAGVLNQVLGSYVHGISTDDLKVAVFKGDVVLTNMRLKVEALNALGLPFRVRAGVVGRLTLRVPWRALGKNPVMVLIEDLHVVAGFADEAEAGGGNGEHKKDPAEAEARADAARAEETRARVDAGETAWLAGASGDDIDNGANGSVAAVVSAEASHESGGDGYFAGMLDTILGNLEVTVRRIHLRLEGELGDVSADVSEASTRDRFALGVTLESLELHTVDAEGAPAFSTKGLAERMRKAATLTRLAVYFDVGAETLKPPDAASWDRVAPDRLIPLMTAGVSSTEATEATEATDFDALTSRAKAQVRERAYLLAPVSASALYERRGKRDAFDAAVPAQRVFLRVDAIETRVASSHLRVAFETAARLERDARRAPHAHVRPKTSVTQAPREWWAFAYAAVTLERRRKGNVTAVPLRLDRVVEAMRARRAYVAAYAAYVRGAWRERPRARARAKQGWFSRRRDDPSATKRWPPPLAVGAAPELDAIEKKLPANVCVLFRALAHAQVRRELGDEDASNGGEEERAAETSGGSWMSGWFGSKNDAGASGAGSGPADAGESSGTDMSEEDWSNLQRVFDVEGHAEVAVAASASAEDDGVASEFCVAVGAASVAFVDDEIVSVNSPEKNTRAQHVEVLRAGLVGFVAGSRAFGGARADHRAAVDAMDVDVSGAKMVRVAGEDSNGGAAADAALSALRGSAAAAFVAERLWRDDEDDVFYDDGADDTEGTVGVASKALRLKFLNAPLGDGAPDVDLGLTLAPAHVVALRAPIDRLVETLSRHKPAQLAEQEEMLRRAVTESASRTAAVARERLAASLADRPEVKVSVIVHAPRVAAPSFQNAAGDDEADGDAATVILDLGRFQLESCGALELGAAPETAKLFNAFKIRVSDVSASVASGRWDPSRVWTVETFDDVAPVIPAFGARATALQALAPVPDRAGLETTFDADAVRVALSPRRVAQLLAVIANVAATAPAPAGRLAAARDDASVADDDSLIGDDDAEDAEDAEEAEWTRCHVLVMSLGRLRWSPSRARVREDAGVASLEFFGVGSARSRRVAAPLPLAGGGALRVSREAAARAHAIAVCADASAVDAASSAMKRARVEDAGRLRGLVERTREQGRVVLVGLDSDRLAERFREHVNAAARSSAQTAPAAVAETVPEPSLPPMSSSSSISFVASLAELSVVVAIAADAGAGENDSARVSAAAGTNAGSSGSLDDVYADADEDAWWLAAFDATSERVLARATLRGVRARASVGPEETAATLELAAFDVFDEHASAGKDAARRLLRVGAAASRDATNQRGEESSTAGGGGERRRGDVFVASYRAVPASSPRYAGVDSDLDLAVGAMCFSARRPTLAALATMPSLVAAYRSDGKKNVDVLRGQERLGRVPGEDDVPGVFSEETISSEPVSLETGKSRVATRVVARVDAFRVALLLDDADDVADSEKEQVSPGCVADARAESLRAELTLYPSTMRFRASMGSLRVEDPRLPVNHPCRVVVRAAAETNGASRPEAEAEKLVDASWETFDRGEHSAADRADAAAFARVSSLRVLYLARFVAECSSFADGLVRAMAEEQTEGERTETGASGDDARASSASAASASSASPGAARRVRVDVALAAPVLVLPRGTHDFSRSVEIDMGALEARNAFEGHLDVLEVRITGVDVALASRAESAETTRARLARDPVAATATVSRRVDFDSGASGVLEGPDARQPRPPEVDTVVRARVAPARLELSSADFKRLAGCVAANAKERPARVPRPTNPARRRDASSRLANENENVPASPEESRVSPGGSRSRRGHKPRRASSGRRARASEGGAGDAADEAGTAAANAKRADARGEISTRLFFAVELAELAVFRGEGRREPLACASLRDLAVDAALTRAGDVLADVSLAAFALEDRRGGRRRAVAGGGATGAGPDADADAPKEQSLPLLRARYAAGAEWTRAAATMQQFTLEVDPTFLLDVGRVFVPSLAGGGGESPEDVLPDDLRLVPGEPFFWPPGETLELHPTRRVVADGARGGEYELDCGGGAIVIAPFDTLNRVPLIFVGPGAELRIRNARVEVEAASDADARAAWASLVSLAPGAKIRAGEEDRVYVSATAPATLLRRFAARRDDRGSSEVRKISKSSYSLRAVRLQLRVLGDERETNRDAGDPDAVDALELDFGVDARADAETDEEGASVEAQARLARLSATVNGAPTLAPLDIVAMYVSREDALGVKAEDARVTFAASPVSVALSMDRLAVVARVSSRLAAAAARAPTISCAAFRKTWSSTFSSSPDAASPTAPVLFEAGAAGTRAGAAAWSTWRPHPPPGYASLGDVVGDGGADVPPSAPSVAIRDSPAFTAAPLSFERVSFSTPNDASSSTLAVWRPVPPPGFVALGVACSPMSEGAPPLDALRCVRRELVAAAVGARGRAGAGEGAPPLWVVENAARTLAPSSDASGGGPLPEPCLDLRVPTGLPGDPASAKRPFASSRLAESGEERTSANDVRDDEKKQVPKTRYGVDAKTVVDFDRVWHSFNAGAAAGDLSVWRARCPPGWVSLGDVAVAGLEPPARTVLFRETKTSSARGGASTGGETEETTPALAPPAAFERVWRDSGWRARGKPRGTLSFWRPVPSDGYVACGHVASGTHAPPPIDVVACLRADLACAVPPSAMGSAAFARGGRRKFAKKRRAAAPISSLWSAEGAGFKLGREPLRIWRPRAPLAVFADDDDADDENGWLALGAFHAVAGDAAAGARAPQAHAPRATRPFAPPAAGLPRTGTVVTARVERVETTLFVNEDENGSTRENADEKQTSADACPLARVSMRRVSLDARAGARGDSEACVSAVVDASHFNARVAAWEPVVEPWEVFARYEVTTPRADTFSDTFDARPRGCTVRVEGAAPLRVVATRAFAEDLTLASRAKLSEQRLVSANAKNAPPSFGLKNALGVPLYVRSGDGATVVEVPPGARAPFVGFGDGETLLRDAFFSREQDDADEPTYLIVEVLETRNAVEFETARFELLDNEGESTSVLVNGVAGATMLDVGEWRARVRRRGQTFSDVALAVRVTLEPSLLFLSGPLSTRTAEGGTAREENDPRVGATVRMPASALLAASADRGGSSGWFPSRDGFWVDANAESASGTKKSVRMRARIAQGLDLKPPRDVFTVASGDGEGVNSAVAETSTDDSRIADRSFDASRPTDETRSRLILRRARRLDLTWWSKNSGASDFSAWTPSCPPGTAVLGTTVVASFVAPPEALVAPAPWLLAKADAPTSRTGEEDASRPTTKPAVGFASAFRDSGSRLRKNPRTGTFAAWRPIAPEGYVAVGCVVTRTHDPPDPNTVACVRADLAALSAPAPAPLWTTEGAEGKLGAGKLSVYRTGVAAGAGWIAVADGNAAAFTDAHELRWDAALGARVSDDSDDEDVSVDVDEKRRDRRAIALSPEGPWTPAGSRALGGADVAATFAGGAGSVVVVDRREGCVRAPATLVARDVPFALEARLVRVGGGGALSRAESSAAAAAAAASFANARVSPVVEVFESERFFPLVGWREPKSPFDEFFTARYGDVRGANSASHFRDVPLPEGWRWVGPWTVDRDHDVDDKGWAYGVNWVTRWPPPRGSHKRGLNATRRRRWTRRRALIGDDVVKKSGSSRDASANEKDRARGSTEIISVWRGATSGPRLTRSDVAADATFSSRDIFIALPLGCGDALAGGAADLALDLRLLHDDASDPPPGWAFDASFEHRGEEATVLGVVPATAAWPVPVGRLGSAVGKGPWLARCGGKFVAVTAERDPDVASASGVDAFQEGVSAWRLVARAPAVLTNALPCALRFAVVRDADGATVARGVAPPGTPTGIFDADPRVPSRLELVPLDARGSPTGACVRAVGLFGDALDPHVRDPRAGGSRVRIPSEALVAPFRENENAESGVAAPLRLAVSVDRADPSGARGRPGAPAPLVVDVRTPLVVANGCPFALAVSSFAAGGVGGVVVAPGEHAPAATPETPPERPGGKKKAPTQDASGALGSGALAPRELWVGAPGGAATKISLEAGAPPLRFAVAAAGGEVELAASAAAWAPPGVSAAAPAPSLRVAVAPTLAVLNLSNVAVAVLAADRGAGAAPQVLPPGAGPAPVTRGHALRAARRENRGNAGDDDGSVALAFGLAGAFPLAREVPVADLAAASGGVLVCLPGALAHPVERGGDVDKTVSFSPAAAVLRATVELAGDGCRLVVLRGGDGAASAAAANVRLENFLPRETVWARQTRRVTTRGEGEEKGASGRFVPTGAWVEVGTGSCVPWALEDPARLEARSASSASSASSAPVPRRERGASRFAGHDDNDDEDDDVEDEDEAIEREDEDTFLSALAGSADASAASVTSDPAFVEVYVGDDPEKAEKDAGSRADGEASAFAVLSVPAAVARGSLAQSASRGGDDSFFADGERIQPAAFLRASSRASGDALVAVRRRFENGRLALSFAPAADAEDEKRFARRFSRLDSRTGLAVSRAAGPSSPEDAPECAIGPESVLELSLPSLSLSVVDGAEEILFLSLDGVEARRASGLGVGGGSAATELAVAALQADDPHPGAAFPVMVWHDPERGPLLRATLTSVAREPTSSSSSSRVVASAREGEGKAKARENENESGEEERFAAAETRFPAACFATTPAGVHLRVHESAVWRLVAFASALAEGQGPSRRVSGDGSGASQSTARAASTESSPSTRRAAKAKAEDPAMRLDVLRVSRFVARVTFKPAAHRRPPSVGPALAATLSMLNLDRLRFEVGEFQRRRARARASQLAAAVLAHARREGTKQALAVLASVNHLSNVAGTLERAGETIRGLGERDDGLGEKDEGGGGDGFRRSAVGDAVDELTGGRKNVVTGALVGGGELAAGVLGGVGGIFTKSIAGFKKSGLQGLADGAARGVVGAATSTAAGAVGFAARVVEGVEATVGGVSNGLEEALVATDAAALAAAKPRRAPLAVRGDGVVRAWDERDAEGARLLRVASTSTQLTTSTVVDTLNPLNIGNTLGSFNAPRGRPFAGGRFEAFTPLERGRALLLSNRHVGVVAVAEERVEWIMAWSEVVAVRVGDAETDAETDPAGVSESDVVVLGRDASARSARKIAACGSAAAAAAASRRVAETWAAARAAAARRGGGGGARGGGVF